MSASPQGEKQPVRINIFNQSLTVLTEGDPADIHELAHSIDELMDTIARSGNIDATRCAILACLHMADRLRNLERELQHLKQRVDDKSRQFSVLLDQAIGLDDE
jgi:cell division protein ZapA